jgi:GrpB-like predicted nucleotidyltransferase (UPF0157 family)
MLGLAQNMLTLIPYHNEWPHIYEQDARQIREALGGHILDIQHIGSTSIPGMIAKPILDIGIAVKSFELATVCITPLEKLGYEYRGEHGMPRRHYFVRGNPRTHHIHMLEVTSEDWARHLRFRDRLRDDPVLAEEYANLKRDLSRKYHDNRQAYQDAKSSFIRRVENLS